MKNNEVRVLSALVVDDEPDFANLIAEVLEEDGFSVTSACDGVEAFEKVRIQKPDVITLDIQMPRKGGVEFYRELKSDSEFAEIPVVVVTGITKDDKDMENFVRAFLEVEHLPMPDAYVEKPIENDNFIRVVNDALRIESETADSDEIEDAGYALARTLPEISYEVAVDQVKNLLAEEGFGVLTEIDVKKTLKEKLDFDFRRYIILGACNPMLASQALTEEPYLGVLLPCNVVVMERTDGGSIVVAFDPMAAFDLVDNSKIEPIGGEVEAALRRVLTRIG